jgi:hypothetical protein
VEEEPVQPRLVGMYRHLTLVILLVLAAAFLARLRHTLI